MELEDTDDFIQNSYILMVGYLISALISTISTIIIVRLLSVEEYSLLTISYIIPAILIPFSELGLNYASVNFIAKKLKTGDVIGVKNIIKINLIIKVLIGISLTFIVFYISVFIAQNIYKISDIRLIIVMQIASFGIISSILYETTKCFFLGAQKMKIIQFGVIILDLLRAIISISLILLGFHIYGFMIGFILPIMIVSIINLCLINRTFRIEKSQKTRIDWSELSRMIKYGYPLMIFSFVAGIQGQIFIFILTIYGYFPEVSYLNVAIILAAAIGILTRSISLTLFPIFSKISWQKEQERKLLINYFKFSNKFATLIVIPFCFILIIFSEDILTIIFGESYRPAALFVSIYFFIFFLIPLGSLSIPAFFNGQKYTKYVLYIEMVFLFSGVLLSLLFINLLGGLGLIIGFLLGEMISIIYGNILIRKKFGNVLFSNFKNLLFILFIGLFVGIIIFFINSFIRQILPFNGLVLTFTSLFIVLILYFTLYILLISIFSLISVEEIDFMVSAFKNFPLIYPILRKVANLLKIIVQIRTKK